MWAAPSRKETGGPGDCIPRAVESCDSDARAGTGAHMLTGIRGREGRAGPVVTMNHSGTRHLQWADSFCLFPSNTEPTECLLSVCLHAVMHCVSSTSRCPLLYCKLCSLTSANLRRLPLFKRSKPALLGQAREALQGPQSFLLHATMHIWATPAPHFVTNSDNCCFRKDLQEPGTRIRFGHSRQHLTLKMGLRVLSFPLAQRSTKPHT